MNDTYINIFNFIKKQTYKGVEGCWLIDSKKEGPTLGISILTHGNEPSGLQAIKTIQNISHKLQKGRVLIIANNLKAGQNYFDAKTEEDKRITRFVHLNMNRMPENLSLADNNIYEIQRAKDLMPVWDEIDVGFDIHSTSQACEPMILQIKGDYRPYCKGFPIHKIIENITEIQIGVPASHSYGKGKDIPVIAIESGSHEEESSFKIVEKCTEALLINLGMLEGTTDELATTETYFVYDSIMFPDDTYTLKKIFPMYNFAAKGEIIATGQGQDICLEKDSHILFCPKVNKPSSIDEEVLFLSKKLRS